MRCAQIGRDCKVQLPDTLWKLLPAHTRRDLSSASASRAAAACTDDPPGWCDADYAVVGDDDEEESGDDDEPYVYIKADTMVEEMFEVGPASQAECAAGVKCTRSFNLFYGNMCEGWH
jgi:hypothetical protein